MTDSPKIAKHYFDLETAPVSDAELARAKALGIVPQGCLLGGQLVWGLKNMGKDPCKTCDGPRGKCGGRERL